MTYRYMHAILLISTVMIGCSNPDDDAIAIAKTELEKRLKDPTSVQYKIIKVVHATEGEEKGQPSGVCLEFNAKNGFGAYVGFKKDFCSVGKTEEEIFCFRSAPQDSDANANIRDMAVEMLVEQACSLQ